jgi:allophanate hydrolase subunit 2
MGVSPSGAADPVALQLANLLVGNQREAAALEMTLTGGRFHFPMGAMIALTGADLAARVGERSLEMWIPHAIPAGGAISFGATRNCARCYLAIAGGIDVEPFLGSASTHLVSGLGGFSGRALRKGDVVPLGHAQKFIRRRKLASRVIEASVSPQPRAWPRRPPLPQRIFIPPRISASTPMRTRSARSSAAGC